MKNRLLITFLFLSFFTQANAQISGNIKKHKHNFTKAQQYFNNDNYEVAIRYYTDALENAPKDELLITALQSFVERGFSKYSLDDFEGAMADFNTVLYLIEYDKGRIKLGNERGNLDMLRYLGNLDILKKLRAAAYFGKGVVYKETNNISESCKNLTKAANLGMKDSAYEAMEGCPY
jgi:tetratricopeptide (TPR) repeat protein